MPMGMDFMGFLASSPGGGGGGGGIRAWVKHCVKQLFGKGSHGGCSHTQEQHETPAIGICNKKTHCLERNINTKEKKGILSLCSLGYQLSHTSKNRFTLIWT